MNHRFPLDVSSFQELLMAAWVLQSQRDLELSESPDKAIHSSSSVEAIEAIAASLAEIKVTHRQSGGTAEASLKEVSPSASPDVASYPPNILRKPVFPKQQVALKRGGRSVVFKLVRTEGKDEALLTLNVGKFRPMASLAKTYAGPVSVLLIMIAFLLSLLGGHQPVVTSVNAAPQLQKAAVDESLMHEGVRRALYSSAEESKPAQTGVPLGPSHLQVTDTATLGVVENLSRYEIPTLKRQAQYGDDVAALTLGMAYELGRYVPQSCAQAAKWIAISAAAGNPAGQYNLGLRYLYGDGTASNPDEARKWLEQAKGHGYRSAELALRASGGL